MVGLDDPEGLLQPKHFYDSKLSILAIGKFFPCSQKKEEIKEK